MFFSKQPTQHWLVGSEQGKVTHLDTIERCHTHVEEHTIEHWHGNELKNTENSKKDINVTRVTVTYKKEETETCISKLPSQKKHDFFWLTLLSKKIVHKKLF